jgi:hypothetical protein
VTDSTAHRQPFNVIPMKYDDKYPETNPGPSPERNITKTEYDHQALPCEACGTMTRWFHQTFIEHVCSEECRKTLPWMN